MTSLHRCTPDAAAGAPTFVPSPRTAASDVTVYPAPFPWEQWHRTFRAVNIRTRSWSLNRFAFPRRQTWPIDPPFRRNILSLKNAPSVERISKELHGGEIPWILDRAWGIFHLHWLCSSLSFWNLLTCCRAVFIISRASNSSRIFWLQNQFKYRTVEINKIFKIKRKHDIRFAILWKFVYILCDTKDI